MPTGQTIINNALTTLGVLEQGGTPSSSDSVDALAELNAMWDGWSVDEGIIYSVQANQYPLTANIGTYTIGSGAALNGTRPARIYSAVFVAVKVFTGTTTSSSATVTTSDTSGLAIGQLVTGTGIPTAPTPSIIAIVSNTSITLSRTATASGTVTLRASGGNRNELKIVEQGQYYSHNDLGALATTPEEIYPDYNVDSNGYATLYLWPIPTLLSPANLEIESGVTFSTWTLGANYQIPPGYQDWINYSLAARLIPRYGAIVDAKVTEMVIGIGAKAEARVREMNAKNRKMGPEMMASPVYQVNPQQPAPANNPR